MSVDEARDEDDDRLTSVPAEVWGMGGSLTKMTVAGHAIASLPPQALKSLERLVLLDLSNNRLGGGGAAATGFIADAARLPSLATLNLRGNQLTDDDIFLCVGVEALLTTTA